MTINTSSTKSNFLYKTWSIHKSHSKWMTSSSAQNHTYVTHRQQNEQQCISMFLKQRQCINMSTTMAVHSSKSMEHPVLYISCDGDQPLVLLINLKKRKWEWVTRTPAKRPFLLIRKSDQKNMLATYRSWHEQQATSSPQHSLSCFLTHKKTQPI